MLEKMSTLFCVILVIIFGGHIMSGFCHPSSGRRKQKTLNRVGLIYSVVMCNPDIKDNARPESCQNNLQHNENCFHSSLVFVRSDINSPVYLPMVGVMN